jgi:hypothetical protein
MSQSGIVLQCPASDNPPASRSRMNSTARQVPLITGFPAGTFGSATIRSCQFITMLYNASCLYDTCDEGKHHGCFTTGGNQGHRIQERSASFRAGQMIYSPSRSQSPLELRSPLDNSLGNPDHLGHVDFVALVLAPGTTDRGKVIEVAKIFFVSSNNLKTHDGRYPI